MVERLVRGGYRVRQEFDITKFFDSVPWDLLIKAVGAHTNLGCSVELIAEVDLVTRKVP